MCIVARFDGRVFLIDSGMMLEEKRQGRASALEIKGDRFIARYAGGEQEVLWAPPRANTTPAQSAHSLSR